LASATRLVVAGALVGFVLVVALKTQSPAPESRLPGAYRLSALIDRQQKQNDEARAEVQQLQTELQQTRQSLSSQQAGATTQNGEIQSATTAAGLVAVKGTGFTVTLNDSSRDKSSTDNVNNLVIHSQDVQAVVNAMWQSGAQAIAINGQRLISTSAVLCVGNTLLLNGSVYAPPYEISAVGADRGDFGDDPLVRQLHNDATKYALQFSVGREQSLELPAYDGPTATKFATPSS
jgi:uncharacterized protein YlxW (UPF0749 family)